MTGFANGLAHGERVTTPYGVGEVWAPCVAGKVRVKMHTGEVLAFEPDDVRPWDARRDAEVAMRAAKEILAAVAEEFWSMFPRGLVKPERKIGISDAVTPADISSEMAARYIRRVRRQREREAS